MPDDNGTSEVEQSQIISSFLFVTNQEFLKAVHKRMNNLHNPAAGTGAGMMFQLLLFLTTRANVHSIKDRLKDCVNDKKREYEKLRLSQEWE